MACFMISVYDEVWMLSTVHIIDERDRDDDCLQYHRSITLQYTHQLDFVVWVFDPYGSELEELIILL